MHGFFRLGVFRRFQTVVATCLLLAVTSLRAAETPTESAATPPLPPGLYAEFGTPRGTLIAELFFEKTPLTVASFAGLAEGKLGPAPRKPYFDGLTFHRVVPDFVVQGGDPLGTGEGGPGYEFQDELRGDLHHDAVGMLSMANAGPDTNGSQFFFTLRPVNRLDFLHSVFGRVVRGIEVLPLIQQGDAMTVKIHRVGALAQAFAVDDAAFARWSAQTPKARLPHFDDPQQLLPASPPRARAFGFKLDNVERFTGKRIYARVFEKREPGDTAAKPGELAKRFAASAGVIKDGVVALYYADRDEWALWIGEELFPKFNPQGLSTHDAKQAFLKAARERAAAFVSQQEKAGPLPPQQKLKLQVDEVLAGLIDLVAR